MDINNITFEAIDRYFTTLSQYGTKSYSDVDKLIVLMFIRELLTGELGILINEKDYRTITEAFYCLTCTTCLISYPDLPVPEVVLFQNYINPPVRITEQGDYVRQSQDERIRIAGTNYYPNKF